VTAESLIMFIRWAKQGCTEEKKKFCGDHNFSGSSGVFCLYYDLLHT